MERLHQSCLIFTYQLGSVTLPNTRSSWFDEAVSFQSVVPESI